MGVIRDPPISEFTCQRPPKLIVLGLSVLLASFVITGGLGVKANTNDDGSYRQLGVYSEVLSRIRTEYVEEPNIPSGDQRRAAWPAGIARRQLQLSRSRPSTRTTSSARKARPASAPTVSKRYGYAAVISVIPGGPADKAEIAERRHHRGHRRQVHA